MKVLPVQIDGYYIANYEELLVYDGIAWQCSLYKGKERIAFLSQEGRGGSTNITITADPKAIMKELAHIRVIIDEINKIESRIGRKTLFDFYQHEHKQQPIHAAIESLAMLLLELNDIYKAKKAQIKELALKSDVNVIVFNSEILQETKFEYTRMYAIVVPKGTHESTINRKKQKKTDEKNYILYLTQEMIAQKKLNLTLQQVLSGIKATAVQ
jgi:hypothetical protein